ncbi:MAG: cupin [Desulfitibacter sp. BRH_c19]|nr:MAG: cupin [Desulfitibacter sp. BRH_c19]
MIPCRVSKVEENGFIKITEGIDRKAVVYGKETLLCEFKLEKNAVIPMHEHPHEQTGFLVSGKVLFTIDGKEYEMKAGDTWCILGNVEHKAKVLENSFIIEVFSPVREEFINK